MRIITSLFALVFGSVAAFGADERINHDGRILGTLPVVPNGTTILFNTTQADAIVSAMQIMPRDSAWNEDISARPVAANSTTMITNIRNDVYTGLAAHEYDNRRRLVVFEEMNYVLVPNNQPLVDVRIRMPGDEPEEGYPDESDDRKSGTDDISTVPYPGTLPVESWPSGRPMGETNNEWQTSSESGDRHTITVMPGTGTIWESWIGRLTAETQPWVVSVVARFDLNSNTLRPAGWTSADAAGLPMFPALVRYDEVQRGMVEHAVRIVVKRSRQNYIYPASHQAGSTTNANYPSMGQRLRIKSSFAIPVSWSAQERAVALGLKKYGALVADNGSFFSVSICPDDRWPANCWDHFSTGAGSDFLDITNFEVVDATTATGGPRSAGAPTCNAGADQGVTVAAGAALIGSATGSGLTTLWEVYPTPTPPGTVTFANANARITTATFSAVGTYTLRLKASDGTHAPAYDAVVITVTAGSNPVPTLSSFTPTTKEQNSGAFTLTVDGANFVPASRVTWTGRADLHADTATANQLTVTVPASYLATAGTPQLAVTNPASGGGTTSSQVFTITAAPGGGGSGGGGSGGGGGCGLGALSALLMLGLGLAFSRRFTCGR